MLSGPTLLTLAEVVVAGLVAGAMNAIAGGGSFVSLPVLIHAGLPSTIANASSTIGLFPGSVATVAAFGRKSLRRLPHASLPVLMGISLAGGVIGALLLLVTSPHAFDLFLPWLLLAATLALLFGGRLSHLRAEGRAGAMVLLPVQFALGIYCGYFGGAAGIMTMAAWLLIEGGEFKALNPTRALIVTTANATAVVIFLVAGAWRWRETSALLVGAIAGGWIGAKLASRLPEGAVRVVVRAFAVVVTLAFFWRAYGSLLGR